MIDRESHISMYAQIASQLESKIQSGELQPDDKIPTEAEITETYQVSRVTARLAINLLLEKGLVVRKQGKGTFVTNSLLRQELGGMEGFYDSFIAKDMEAKLLTMQVIDTPPEVMDILGDTFNRTLHLNRIYMRDQNIYGYSHVYMPVELAKTVTWDIAAANSGYSLLTKHSGYMLKNARMTIRAFTCTEEQAETLKIEPGEPLLRLSRTSFNHEDKPVEHLKLYLRSDISEFSMTIPGNFHLVDGIRDAGTD